MKPLRCSLPLLLSCLGLMRGGEPRGPPGSHSLHYSFSFLSEPLPGVPQYSVVGCVDDVPIIGYSSESRRAGPRAPWMEKITDEEPHFWDQSTKMLKETKKNLYGSLRNLMKQNNPSVGLHVLQVMMGCELREDGSANWIKQYAYDGSNLNTANMGRATDTQDQGNFEAMKCTEHLKKLLKFGEESLRRRVTPRTLVSQRKSGDYTFLIGYAYGFYPREIEVKWVQDGVEIPWASKELLPNPDGTYQVRTTVEVQEGDDVKTYEFHVNHSSLPGTVTATYAPRPGGREGSEVGRTWLVGPTVLLAWLLLLLTLGFIRELKRQRSRKRPLVVEATRRKWRYCIFSRRTTPQLGPAPEVTSEAELATCPMHHGTRDLEAL